MKEDAPQRQHSLREVFNGLRYIVRTGAQWHMMPNDLPPWHTVYQQTQRWLEAGVFENMVRDRRMLMREINDRMPQRCMWPLICLTSCWQFWSRQPTNKTVPKWLPWLNKFKR